MTLEEGRGFLFTVPNYDISGRREENPVFQLRNVGGSQRRHMGVRYRL